MAASSAAASLRRESSADARNRSKPYFQLASSRNAMSRLTVAQSVNQPAQGPGVSFNVASESVADASPEASSSCLVHPGSIIESLECGFGEADERQVAAGEGVQTATFGMGCFWKPDAIFGIMPGVIRTRVGYTGGSSRNPSYEEMGDHTEAVQVEFDPRALSYEDLLEAFWDRHSPSLRYKDPQYASLVVAHTREQLQAASASRERAAAASTRPVGTRVEAAGRFYVAEPHHQKFSLQNHARELLPLLGLPPGLTWREFIDSPLTAKINGLLGGEGGRDWRTAMQRATKDFQLPEEAKLYIKDVLQRLAN